MDTNKNGSGSNVSSATPAGSAQTVTSPASTAARETVKTSPARSARGRSTGATQDTAGVNTMRDTSGAFSSRDAARDSAYDSADRPSVAAAGVRVRNDARQLIESISTFTAQAQEVVTRTLDERPYVALGTAFGIGYLLGGGLRSKLTGLALTVGGRYVLNNMSSQLLGQVRR